jgi:hypothetical protein
MLLRTRRNTIGRRSTLVPITCRAFLLRSEHQSLSLSLFVRFSYQFSSVIGSVQLSVQLSVQFIYRFSSFIGSVQLSVQFSYRFSSVIGSVQLSVQFISRFGSFIGSVQLSVQFSYQFSSVIYSVWNLNKLILYYFYTYNFLFCVIFPYLLYTNICTNK